MIPSHRSQEAHIAQANLRRSSRIANRPHFNPEHRRLPHILSNPSHNTSSSTHSPTVLELQLSSSPSQSTVPTPSLPSTTTVQNLLRSPSQSTVPTPSLPSTTAAQNPLQSLPLSNPSSSTLNIPQHVPLPSTSSSRDVSVLPVASSSHDNHDQDTEGALIIERFAPPIRAHDLMFMIARRPYVEPYTSHDCGPMNILCPHCGALHWKDERVYDSSLQNPQFSLCCAKGKVHIRLLDDPPSPLRDLFVSQTSRAKEFRLNIVSYNRALAFTSIGVKEDHTINNGRGPPVFRVHGELKHWSGSLIAPPSRSPSYAQLYIYDPQIALQYRMNNNPHLRRDTMSTLQAVVNQYNPYAQIYLSAYQILQHVDAPDYSLRLCPKSNNHHHNNLSADEVAVIIPGTNTFEGDHRDILLTLRPRARPTTSNSTHNNSKPNLDLQRISEGHPAYCPLHYVLLFPYGEAGWHWDLQLTSGKRMSLRQHTAFRIHDRENEFSTILRGGRLLQHYLVDMFAAIDQSRLRWYTLHQSQFRLSHLQGMEDAVNRRDDTRDLHTIGQRTILPSSYTGGPRDLHQRFQDSMAIARHFKKIDIFLTITANPNWPEIKRELLPGQKPDDRPDLIARVFKQKKDALMQLITQKGIFGRCVAHIERIEFQQRGLPHCHILISLARESQLCTPEAIDEVIWARWPDPETQPHLFEKVKKYMLHGPCGKGYNEFASCMENGHCRFGFPKPWQEHTTLTNDGYPLYYRPNDGRAYEVNGFLYTNQWIASFNPFCLEFMDGHANAECAFSFWTNKYLFKYLKKGGDAATVEVADENNEIKKYVEGRYFSAAESAWRIFEFELHGQYPSVIRLPIHLPDDQSFTFNPNDPSEIVLNRGRQVETALTAFFAANRDDGPFKEEARKYTYQEFPQHFTLKKEGDHKFWQKRQQQPALGRMVYVTPTAGERFYLRILLTTARGPKSFEDLQTVSPNEPPCPTFYEACIRRGLLENDGEWEICLDEACDIRTGSYLRQLFATILLFSGPHYPGQLWENYRHSICDDVHRDLRTLTIANVTEEVVYDYGLYLLNQILLESGKSLSDFPGMPKPKYDWNTITTNRLIAEQLDFTPEKEREQAKEHISSFNEDQRHAFNHIWTSISDERGTPFFVNGPAGTGKTFLYNAICHRVRAESWIILCVASTGLAALLLPQGRTAHSMFKIPISDLAEDSICQIPKESHRAELLRQTKAILYDECLMNNKHCFEALDRTLRDIRDRPESVYGGLTMIHGGDFQQILPVVPKGSRSEIVDASLQRSYLWEQMEIIRLKKNMRLDRSPEEEQFANWLLDVGHGRCPTDEDGQITLPESMVTEEPANFVRSIYGDIYGLQNPPHPNFFRDRAILAPRNTDVKETNDLILDTMPGEEISYWSADNIINDNGEVQQSYESVPLEYLHSLEPAALSPAHLRVKLGCPLILLRNLCPSKGLCNGTRLILLRAESRVLEVRILGTDHDGEVALIPRITLIPSTEEGLTFQFRRKQFPVKLAFAMTINKAEGQSLRNVGLDLRAPVFSHGQLYVGLSRATSSKRVHVLLNPGSNNKTRNVVYPEVLLD